MMTKMVVMAVALTVRVILVVAWMTCSYQRMVAWSRAEPWQAVAQLQGQMYPCQVQVQQTCPQHKQLLKEWHAVK
jgi:hypothetical protein